MTRTALALAGAALLFAAVSGTSQAAPIAPLSANVAAAEHGNVTHVWYHWRWRHCVWHHGHRHCW